METNRARKLVFDNLLKVPHRDYSTVVPAFNQALTEDPDFVSKAMVYLFQTSAIRDQVDAAVITLLQSHPDLGLREAGQALMGLDFYKTRNTQHLKALPPYRLLRIWGYMSGHLGYQTKAMAQRRMRTIMNDYLDFMELNEERFDRVILLNRKAIRELYLWLGRWPTPRYEFLVSNKAEPQGIFQMVKEINRQDNSMEKARLVMEFKLPYTVAASLLPKKDASAHIALIDTMSPQEAANSIGWVEGSGVLEIAEVKDAFLRKIKQAKDVTSMRHRQSSKAKSEAVAEAVKEARDATIKEARKITKRTLLNVDRSGSMHQAIEVAKEFAAFLGSRLESEDLLYIVAFNDVATRIKPKSLSLSDVEKATQLITANGATCCGIGVQVAIATGFIPEQIVTITDGDENRNPRYAQVARSLEEVNHVVIGLGDYHSSFHQELERMGLNVDFFPYTSSGRNDYYLFEQIASILSGQGKKTLVQAIMDIELPQIVR